MFRRILIFICVSIFAIGYAIGQQDTIRSDTTRLYKNIESVSKRTKFGTFMYHIFFKAPVAKPGKVVPKKGYQKLIQKPYSSFEGKIIRNITIITLDPFGYSVTDTTSVHKNFFLNSANKMHIKSQVITIRNLLLFRKHQPFRALEVKESERLVRSQKYVHDVFFFVKSSGTKPDSVDILIRELDRWTIIPEMSFSKTAYHIGLTDKNFVGLGHELKVGVAKNDTTGINAYRATYSIPNIRNTYISAVLNYEVEGNKNFNRSVAIDRPFYSPLTKWAGGVMFASRFASDSLKDQNRAYAPINLKYRIQDYWAGHAHRIFIGNSEDERITNLILTARYQHIGYSEKPSEFNDPLHIYSSSDFYLASVGISTRKYVLDKYIFKYGVIEDVPVGQVYELTGGYQVRDGTGRPYLGIRFSFGNYYRWGYLSTNFEYGTFFRASHYEQGVLSAGINYFTGLIEIRNWKFREFVKPQIIIGINRFSYDSLTINDGHGLDGFYSPSLSGTSRIMFTLQTQSYSPWHIAGFRFGPFFISSLGMIGDAASGFKYSKVYYQLGLGILIKNENLIFNTFQLSLAFYPIIPGRGLNIFKTNSVKTTDFGFRDFEIGKPRQALYQ